MLFPSDPDRDAPGDDLIVRVMRMIDHRDGLEITEEPRGLVMVRLDTRRHMETLIIRCGERDGLMPEFKRRLLFDQQTVSM